MQGMSLERVRVDLAGVFASGQTYVALSRARTMAGLQIVNYVPGLVKVESSI